MVQPQLPFKFQEVKNLTSLGIDASLISRNNMSFESQKYITVKNQSKVSIIDTSAGFTVTQRDFNVEGVMMHPERNVISVRATQGEQTVVQVFDIGSSQKLCNTTCTEKVTYWRWINNNVIALVGAKSVYHLDITNQNGPQKVFDKHANLANTQILNYDVDSDMKWAFLVGLYQDSNRQILSNIQLFSFDQGKPMIIEGYAACFADMPVIDGRGNVKLFAFCMRKANEQVHRFHVTELGQNPATSFKVNCEIQMAGDVPGDIPLIMQASNKYGLIYVVTKEGYFFMYEASTASMVYRQRLTNQPIQMAVRNTVSDGMIAINRGGQVLAINVDQDNLVKFIMSANHIPNAKQVAFKLAARFNLPGADESFAQAFSMALASSDYAGAARIAKDSPGTLLRNIETINKFKTLPAAPGSTQQPIMTYFSTLIDSGVTLNEIESVELARPVLAAGRTQVLEQWMNEKKLTMSDALGDLIRQTNPQLALKVYQNAGAPDKVLQGLIEAGQLDKIMPYCQQTNYVPDWLKILRALIMTNPQAASNLAKMITQRDANGNPKTPIEGVLQIFLEHSRVQEATAFLLDALKANNPNEGHLQTKLLEINLSSAPNIAEGIFQLNLFTHFDKEKIARMCEQVALYARALQNYSNIDDQKRVMLNSHVIPQEIMFDFFGKIGEEECLVCLNELLRANRQNGQLVAEIAIKYANKIDSKRTIQILENYSTNEGLIYFLMNVLPHTDDQDIYFKYIECCTRSNNFKELERVIRETANYDPAKVRDFLMEARIGDPRPLIYLCDMHGFIDDLTKFLFQTNQLKCIEIFLFKVNSQAAPKVLGTLCDLDCDENYIKQLLISIRNCDIADLVEAFDSRNKLRMLTQWLEQRYDERIQEPALHNALAKIYIDSGSRDAQEFLIKNSFYDSKVIGKYCEERNPDLAFTAYKRAWGACDQELIEVSNKNLLYRMQARYLVERQSDELWATVLDPANPHRQSVIDQVVSTALPETKNVDDVSVTVRAFMEAELPNQLIELLERIVLHNSDFADNKSLQNLLVLTAIRSDTSRVQEYISKLEQFDGPQLASQCLLDEHKLYDEALMIYKKFNMPVDAVKVMIHQLQNLKMATEFAEKTGKSEVWSEVGNAQLDQFDQNAAIDAFIRAEDPSKFQRVISLNSDNYDPEQIVKYCLMARAGMKEQMVDSELIFAYAKGGDKYLSELETFVGEPNQANMQTCGDRCFDAKLYLAAEILFKRSQNNQKLAQTYVMLKKYQLAYDAAKKADVPRVWKAVCFACIRAKEFNMAQLCGQYIIIHPDHLEDLIAFYEKFGYVDNLIHLLEVGMNLERTHNGIYTDLAIMYAKYDTKRLMDFIRAHNKRLLIPKLIRECERYQLWNEATYLHSIYDQVDQAILTMIEHSPVAWKHDFFCQNIINVANHDLWYKSMLFYLEEEPMLLNDLLKVLAQKIDLARTVNTISKTGHIALIQPFLESVQGQNVGSVNEALNRIYLENQDFDKLRQSIKEYDSFQSVTLAAGLEEQDTLECRRIASLLYRKNKKYQKSIEISKADGMYKDAMETVAESCDPALAEDLLRYIMSKQEKELVASMLYTCYELIKPDIVMEVGWRYGLHEFVMPYMIQFMRDMSTKVESVQKKTEDIKKKEEAKAQEAASRPLDMGMDMNFMFPQMQNQGPAAIMPAPGAMGAAGFQTAAPMGGMGTMGGANPMAGMQTMPGNPMGGMGGMGGMGM